MQNRRDAHRAAAKVFGPRVELVRVSARERDERFKVCLGSFTIDAGDRPVPLLLGTGSSWESAIDHARTTENGKMAEKTHLAGLEFAKKALNSKSELEFATLVEEETIKETIEAGGSEAAVAAIRHKFSKAREHINVAVSHAAKAESAVERPQDQGGGYGDGSGSGGPEQVGQPEVEPQGPR